MIGEHWTFAEWEQATIERIVAMGLAAPIEHRADYLHLQIGLAIQKALRHGRSGRGDHDPVAE